MQEFYNISHCRQHTWKHKTIHLLTTHNKGAPTREIFYVNPLSSDYIPWRNPKHEMHVSNNIIVSVWCNNACYSKSCGKWRFKLVKSIYPTHSTIHSTALTGHFRFAVLDSMYVLLHFWPIVLKHPVYRKHLNRSNLDILKMKTYSFVSSLWSQSLYCAATAQTFWPIAPKQKLVSDYSAIWAKIQMGKFW